MSADLERLKAEIASGMSVEEIYLKRVLEEFKKHQVEQDKLLEQHFLYGTPIPKEIQCPLTDSCVTD